MPESASELVLILAPTDRDAVAAEQHAGLESVACTGMADLVCRLRAGAGVALVAEEAFAGERPEELRGWLAAQPPWSDFPLLILTSQQVSRRLHAYRLELMQVFANVSLLERPLSAVSMISAVKAGLRARRRQYEVRDHLVAREQVLSIWKNSCMTAPGSSWIPTNNYARRWRRESKPKPLCNKRKRWRRWVR
jgi:hypothetical protein